MGEGPQPALPDTLIRNQVVGFDKPEAAVQPLSAVDAEE